MNQISVQEVEKILYRTYLEIENFKDQLFSRPDDFGHESLKELRSTIESCETAIVDFELINGTKPIYLNPEITKKILETIAFITTKYTPDSEKSGEIIVAINVLIQFQSMIRNIGYNAIKPNNRK